MKKLTKQERFEIIEQALSLDFLNQRQRIVFVINSVEGKLKQKG